LEVIITAAPTFSSTATATAITQAKAKAKAFALDQPFYKTKSESE
jgi:hypothetical protein